MLTSAERKQLIDQYANGYDMLMAALPEFPKAMWQFKPSPADWSIHEIIVHLADSETNAALRARLLAVEPGRSLMAYDQDRWANELDYHDQDPQVALELTRLARSSTAFLLRRLPETTFTHTVHHPEYSDPYSFDQWLKIYAAHIPGHIQQMRDNLRIWQSTQTA